ncbi:MAG: aminoacetone oxidase family FAD-binding enzyme [Candidatus Latescibacteria bacterium]|nr:aminoacetone oxidase family FAD-binding enzyme [Candidatus Latescibacterota bacterium]
MTGRNTWDTLVVGGGAAGIMAAINSAEGGRRTALLEGNQQLGRKVLIAGNGRCNLTNRDADDLQHYHSSQLRFVRQVLGAFPLQRTLEFFRDLGLEVKEEKRGRLFPVSDQAQAVMDLLEERLRQLGVEVVRGARICRAAREESCFQVCSGDGRSWVGQRLVLASGGVSLAKLGADGSGLELARGFGHQLTPLLPGLVPLLSPDEYLRPAQGVKVWAQVRASLGKGHQVLDTDDLLFTPYGVSGFTILNLSAQVVPLLQRGPVELEINLFPGQSPEQVSETLKKRWERHPERGLAFSFTGLLHSKLVGPLLFKLGCPADQPVGRLSKAQRWELARLLTNWPILVSQPRDFDHAEVTIGGVRTSEVDPLTLESYLAPGLYLAGELLDVHGDLGGFNLQWAWASGAVAGRSG